MTQKRGALGTKDDYLVWLWRAKQAEIEAVADMDSCVQELRRLGTPWEEVARALGISRQAAWGRWGGLSIDTGDRSPVQ